MPLENPLFVAGLAVAAATFALMGARRLSASQGAAGLAMAFTLTSLAGFLEGYTAASSAGAATAAYFAWLWWHGGGGDGTRRRLRSLARLFHGTRRTAPEG